MTAWVCTLVVQHRLYLQFTHPLAHTHALFDTREGKKQKQQKLSSSLCMNIKRMKHEEEALIRCSHTVCGSCLHVSTPETCLSQQPLVSPGVVARYCSFQPAPLPLPTPPSAPPGAFTSTVAMLRSAGVDDVISTNTFAPTTTTAAPHPPGTP